MKIQEHPSIPENKLQRNQDADDQENSFVSEVPRLDLTALCDDNNWEGRIVWWLEWDERETWVDRIYLCVIIMVLCQKQQESTFVKNMELKVWRNWK